MRDAVAAVFNRLTIVSTKLSKQFVRANLRFLGE